LLFAARHKAPAGSPVHTPDPLPIKGVIGLAPAADLELTYRNETCGGAAERLVGGTPEEFPQRYHDGSPAALLPLGLPQLIINGAHDEGWLIVSRTYQERARAAGEEVPIIVPPEAGHFELVMPTSATFPLIRAVIEEMLRQ
jgi:pimeloyl-ACP methyl ester carboxylesterase